MSEERFSKRQGFSRQGEADISVRQDAPHEFRGVLIDLAYGCGYTRNYLRSVVCKILHKRPDSNNWSAPNINDEIHQLIDECEWYKVYDVAEGIYSSMSQVPYPYDPERFESELNDYFVENGIGWQLREGKVEVRGAEVFERVVDEAKSVLDETNRNTANNEMREAVKDLSRRPYPDITGAIQHSMASLECVARDVCGDKNATLGEILKKHKDLIPKPLNMAIDKAWGYASNNARHISEGHLPEYEEAELIVGICASVGTYLVKKTTA